MTKVVNSSFCFTPVLKSTIPYHCINNVYINSKDGEEFFKEKTDSFLYYSFLSFMNNFEHVFCGQIVNNTLVFHILQVIFL